MKRTWQAWRTMLRPFKESQASDSRRRGYANAIYGMADYLSLPIGMLLAAPYLLKHLGAAQYGVWMLASAAVSSGGIVSGSFWGCCVKYVGELSRPTGLVRCNTYRS